MKTKTKTLTTRLWPNKLLTILARAHMLIAHAWFDGKKSITIKLR